jgi:hypothetical protein
MKGCGPEWQPLQFHTMMLVSDLIIFHECVQVPGAAMVVGGMNGSDKIRCGKVVVVGLVVNGDGQNGQDRSALRPCQRAIGKDRLYMYLKDLNRGCAQSRGCKKVL